MMQPDVTTPTASLEFSKKQNFKVFILETFQNTQFRTFHVDIIQRYKNSFVSIRGRTFLLLYAYIKKPLEKRSAFSIYIALI